MAASIEIFSGNRLRGMHLAEILSSAFLDDPSTPLYFRMQSSGLVCCLGYLTNFLIMLTIMVWFL